MIRGWNLKDERSEIFRILQTGETYGNHVPPILQIFYKKINYAQIECLEKIFLAYSKELPLLVNIDRTSCMKYKYSLVNSLMGEKISEAYKVT